MTTITIGQEFNADKQRQEFLISARNDERDLYKYSYTYVDTEKFTHKEQYEILMKWLNDCFKEFEEKGVI